MDKHTAATVKVCDAVGFKCDIEQGATVLAIRTDYWRGLEFQVEVTAGEWKGDLIWIEASECF